jgi:hypothetical protein
MGHSKKNEEVGGDRKRSTTLAGTTPTNLRRHMLLWRVVEFLGSQGCLSYGVTILQPADIHRSGVCVSAPHPPNPYCHAAEPTDVSPWILRVQHIQIRCLPEAMPTISRASSYCHTPAGARQIPLGVPLTRDGRSWVSRLTVDVLPSILAIVANLALPTALGGRWLSTG